MALFEDPYDLWISKRLTQQDAARMPGVSDHTVRRWTERYDDGCVDALIDRRLGRGTHNKAPVNEMMELTSTYRERHEGWNVRHYYDHYRDAGGTHNTTPPPRFSSASHSGAAGRSSANSTKNATSTCVPSGSVRPILRRHRQNVFGAI